ncbi:MAG: hypothetical protein MZU91_00565 [Desulfosudis oleivorans]|nr:hypothetical protein [Desulfosudis oleivorans]
MNTNHRVSRQPQQRAPRPARAPHHAAARRAWAAAAPATGTERDRRDDDRLRLTLVVCF